MRSSAAARSMPLSRCGAVDVEIADVDGGPERRLAVPVRGVDVGAALDEITRDGEMLHARRRAARHCDARVQDRVQERRHAVGVGELEIGARLDEQLRDGEIAAPRRVEQRRLRARHRRPHAVLGPAAADDADAFRARVVARAAERGHGAGARRAIDVGACGEQQPRDVGMAFARRDHERASGRIRPRARRRARRRATGARRSRRRRRAPRASAASRRRDRRACASAPASSSSSTVLEIAVRDREVQRRNALSAAEVRIGARVEQQA